MTVKVVLFIDYQNIYRGARNAFGLDSNPHVDGQVDPRRLGELIISKGKSQDRELKEVRIYRGQPDSSKDPKGYGANRRQCGVWARDPLVKVITRTLRYPPAWPNEKEEEKGIDVALAVDFAMMAVKGEFDVGVVMSTDTDLKPAIEAVRNLGGNPFPMAEVAAWKSSIPLEGSAFRDGRFGVIGSRRMITVAWPTPPTIASDNRSLQNRVRGRPSHRKQVGCGPLNLPQRP